MLVSIPAIVVVGLGAMPADGASAAHQRNRCPPTRAPADAKGPSAVAEVVSSSSEPTVLMVRYPRPDYQGSSWSQWGQGLVLANGRYLSAIGDEKGVDGDSFLFSFDPETNRLTRIGDVISQSDHQKGESGYGKIHGQIVAGPCGDVYFATYWGRRDDLQYTESYEGDLLFHFDPATLDYESLGVPVEGHGVPSLAGIGKNGIVYGEAVDPNPPRDRGHDQGAFFVYDTARQKVVFRADDPEHTLFRNVMVDAKGRAYVAKEGGGLFMYEPGAKKLVSLDVRLPGGGDLRASTRPAPDGTIYGVTQGKVADRDHELFAFTPPRTVRSLGAARGYTASLALNEDGSRLYYVPGAHGDSAKQGTPVIAVDTRSGDQSVVTRLDAMAREHLGLTLAGSYNVAFDPKRNRLYVGLNAGKDPKSPWGEVVLAVIDLPR